MFPSLVWSFSLPGVSSLACCLFPLGPFGFRASSFISGLLLLGPSSALLCVLSSGLFRHWAFPLLARSWFLFFSFSPLGVIGAFVHTQPGGPLSGVSPLPVRLVSFGRCTVLFLSLVLLSPLPVFRVFVQRLRPLSLRFLVLFAYPLWQLLSAFFRGDFVVSCPCFASLSCSSCYHFSLSSFAFVSPRSLSRTFSKGALSFFVFSPLVQLPLLLLLLLGVLRLLLLPLLPFGLIACGVLRLRGLFRVMLLSLLSLRLLLGLLLSSLRFPL